jgi:hypothetical protein
VQPWVRAHAVANETATNARVTDRIIIEVVLARVVVPSPHVPRPERQRALYNARPASAHVVTNGTITFSSHYTICDLRDRDRDRVDRTSELRRPRLLSRRSSVVTESDRVSMHCSPRQIPKQSRCAPQTRRAAASGTASPELGVRLDRVDPRDVEPRGLAGIAARFRPRDSPFGSCRPTPARPPPCCFLRSYQPARHRTDLTRSVDRGPRGGDASARDVPRELTRVDQALARASLGGSRSYDARAAALLRVR